MERTMADDDHERISRRLKSLKNHLNDIGDHINILKSEHGDGFYDRPDPDMGRFPYHDVLRQHPSFKKKLSRHQRRQGHAPTKTWAKKLGLHLYQPSFSGPFRKDFEGILEQDSFNMSSRPKTSLSSEILTLIDPIVHDYLRGVNSDEELVRVITIAHEAASRAMRERHLSSDLRNHGLLIQNYVQYSLFLGMLFGEGKHFPFSEVDLEGVVSDHGTIRLVDAFKREGRYFGIDASLESDCFASRKIIEQEATTLILSGDYSRPHGIYFLTDALRDAIHAPWISPSLVYAVIDESVSLESSHFERPRVSLELANAVRDILNDADAQALSEYGSPSGVYALAKSVEGITGEDVSLSDLFSLIATKEKVSSLMDSPSAWERLASLKWSPFDLNLSYDQLHEILDYLKSRYSQNGPEFIRRYGAIEGDYNLAYDLEAANISIGDIASLHALTGSPSLLETLLCVKDEHLLESWHPQPISGSFRDVHRLIAQLMERYAQNPDLFFSLYGNPASSLLLSKELKFVSNTDMSPSDISSILSDKALAGRLLGISEDPRLSSFWNITYTNITLDDGEKFASFLQSLYRSNRKSFFNHLSQPSPLADYASSQLGLEPHLPLLEEVLSDGRIVSLFIGINDKKFAKFMKPLPSESLGLPIDGFAYRKEANISVLDEPSRYIAQIKRNGTLVKQLAVLKREGLTAAVVQRTLSSDITAGKYDGDLTKTYDAQRRHHG